MLNKRPLSALIGVKGCSVYYVYSIGFAADKLLTVNIKSEAGNDQLVVRCCGHASILVNGKEYSKRGRGYNVVVVNGQTGILTELSSIWSEIQRVITTAKRECEF